MVLVKCRWLPWPCTLTECSMPLVVGKKEINLPCSVCVLPADRACSWSRCCWRSLISWSAACKSSLTLWKSGVPELLFWLSPISSGRTVGKKKLGSKWKVCLLQNCLAGTAVPAESFRQDLVLGKILVFGAGRTSSGSCQMTVLLGAALSPLAKTGMVSVVALRLSDPLAVGKMQPIFY